MTPRSIRRAAERKARKLALKAEKQALTGGDTAKELDWDLPLAPPEVYTAPISPARLAANQANAQLSTGPRTAAGKEACSLNALKTGLTGRTVLLPSDDAQQYRFHIDRIFAEYNPATDQERDLVQTIADTAWRLLRIPVLEANLFALGRIQFADMFQDQPAGLRPGLVDAHTLIAFQKQFGNLGLQEARLLRRFAKTRAELAALQSQRREAAAASLKPGQPVGFEFSDPPQPAPNPSLRGAGFSPCGGFSNPPADTSSIDQDRLKADSRKLTAES